jgi:hypothetical protein
LKVRRPGTFNKEEQPIEKIIKVYYKVDDIIFEKMCFEMP